MDLFGYLVSDGIKLWHAEGVVCVPLEKPVVQMRSCFVFRWLVSSHHPSCE